MKNRTLDKFKLYSVGLLQEGPNFKVVDSYLLQSVNQYKRDWRKVNARNVARQLNRGNLVVS